ncbi:MAG: hypothetical protein C0500_02340 [Sphingobium sp.]|nr:hypothetical protein [Sphingobium sp.]
MRSVFITLSLLLAGSPAGAAGLCAAAGEVVAKRACAESAIGIAVADDAARARQLLDYAKSGEARFQARFGRLPVRYAVVETSGGAVEGAGFEGLKAAGFRAILPWLSSAGYRAQIEASIKRDIEAQTASLPPEVRSSIIEQALARFKEKPPEMQDEGGIPHELGHMWYAAAFWPGSDPKGGHYGSEGPDWMDEVAAVMMESDALAKQRVSQFGDRFRKLSGDAARAADPLLDLPRFFASTHPGAERAKKMSAEFRPASPDGAPVDVPRNGIFIRASSGPEAEKFADSAVHYYLQSTMVTDYLADRTGDPAVFARIGAAFARGETMEQWLANKEPKGKLPRDLKALQADWLSWLDQRFPAAPAQPAA